MRWWVAVAGLGASVWATEAHGQAPRYELKVLQTEGQCFRADATALDDQGRVLGFNYGMCGQPPRGRVWTVEAPDNPMLLPSVLGASWGHDNGSMAWGMSNGRITGAVWSYDGEAPFSPRPLIWENGVTRELPLPAGWRYGEGRAINAAGDVVGRLIEQDGERIGFWPAGGAPIVLGPGLAGGMANDLNDAGQVVGCGAPPTNAPWTPFVWQNGQLTTLPPSNWNNQFGCAQAINEAGVIAGWSDHRPVFWKNGALQRLMPAGFTGWTIDLNESGTMIGMMGERPFYASGGEVWDLANLIDDEATVKPGIEGVARINGTNQIVAYRTRPRDEDGPFPDIVLLTPKPWAGNNTAITMTSPWNGEPLTDLATIKVNASSMDVVGGVTFFQYGGQPLGAEDTTAPYAVEVDLQGTGPIAFYARVRDQAGHFRSTPLRFATVSNTCQTAAVAQTVNGSIGARTGQFSLRWTGRPSADPGTYESGFALAQGTPGGFSGTAAAVLFGPNGHILVRNGASYLDTGVAYTLEVSHHFRMDVDVTANRYSVWLKLANQPERALATGVAFRTAASQLDHWIARVDESTTRGSLDACNVRVP